MKLSAWLGLAMALSAVFSQAGAVTPVSAPAAIASSIPRTPQFRRYGVADGIPSGAVYPVAQDRNGLMWFGSAGGLVRFDGVSFKVLRHVVDDPASLPSNQTYALLVDSRNNIWAGGVTSGLTRYDQASGSFRQWLHADDDASSLAGNEVWSIAQTVDGSLWVGTQAGLDRMRKDGHGFDHVPFEDPRPAAAPAIAVRALLADDEGQLWIGAQDGLYLRKADGSIRRVAVDPAFHGDIGKVWRIDGNHGDIRVAVEGGLLEIGADGIARPLPGDQLSALRILGSSRDAQGRLWMGSLTGVWLDDGSARLQHIPGQPMLSGGLPGDRLWQVMRDREGGLWFTFDQSSIAYLPPGWNGVTRYTHIPDDPQSLSDTAALAVQLASDGKLWVGGVNGWVDKLDTTTGAITHVVQGLRGNMASLAEDARGRLWIAGPGMLYRHDHGQVSAFDASRTHLSRPTGLVAGGDGLYVSSWGEGVFALDPDSLASTPLLPPDAPDAARQQDQLTFAGGHLWYASGAGLMRSNDASRQLSFIAGVPRGEILSFALDAGGFWLATDRALEHYRYAGERAERDDRVDISRMDFAANLMAIRIDRQNHVWLFANPGLWRFDPATRAFSQIGAAQGLASTEFSNGSTEIGADGTLFAASSGGVMAFQPQKLDQPAPPTGAPQLTVTSISVRRGGNLVALPLGQPLRLQWRDRDLRIESRLASYVDPSSNRYWFRMHGLDSGWVEAGTSGSRDFAGLAPGSYTLEARAADAAGSESAVAAITLRVEAPPWQRWWAWLAYLLVLAAASALLLHGWRRRLAQRHELALMQQQRLLAEAASAAKTQFLATLSHEIRTPMTGVMGMAELLLSTPLNPQQHDYTTAMQRSGSMLLKLLNDALDLARIEAGRFELEPAPFDPRQLLDDVARLEQGLAQGKGLQFSLELVDELPAQVIGDAIRIKQVLLNLANNALKFTERGSVCLRAQPVANGLLFSVTDTGPGIPEASQARLFQRFEQVEGPQRSAGSGLGLAICRELVEMMGGSIELESRVGHGSTFRVRLPLQAPASAQQLTTHSDDDGRVHQLLLVEDDSIVAAVIGGLLERQGHRVQHVVNGLAALAEMAQRPFDAVLLDLDLPGVDGFQIARLIRQRETDGRRLPIIAVTARSGGEDEAKARASGMDGFLRKPLTGGDLGAMLAQVLRAGEAVVADPD